LVSCSRDREILFNMLQSIGLNKQPFGFHSLRSDGDATAANTGIPDHLFKRHGRWKNDRAKSCYVQDDIDNITCFEIFWNLIICLAFECNAFCWSIYCITKCTRQFLNSILLSFLRVDIPF
jgi:hypothetical protein